MTQYILSFDQGTTGTTVSLVHANGEFITQFNKEHKQIYPQPGWVEHNPTHIWKSTVLGIQKVLQTARIQGSQIAAIGITNQRETCLIWERKSHRPLYNAIVWQCRRTTNFCEKLKRSSQNEWEKTIFKKTGLVIDPYFSASKFKWILDAHSGARARVRRGELLGGTIDAYLIWKLTGGVSHVTDVSNASRTQLMDITNCQWDEELLAIYSVPKRLLPQIHPSSGVLGHTKNVPGLPNGIPISGVAGDQQASLFGQTCFRFGEAKCTFGTGSFILMNTGSKKLYSKYGMLTTVAWQLKNQKSVTYALEGGAFICGALVQWLRDEMQFFKKSSDIEALARSVEDSGGVELVPAFVGLGAPHWVPQARGTLTGLTRGSHRGHLARAALDAMALQNVDILEAMAKDLGKKLKNLRVDGGAAHNSLLIQLQANYLGAKILKPQQLETTSAGAAYLAGLGVGIWSELKDIQKVWNIDREFEPEMSPAQRNRRLSSWRQALACTVHELPSTQNKRS